MQGYTLAQIEAFIASVDKCQRDDARLALFVARGARANAKQFKKILKEFD